jgi:hypothetical protein
MRYSDLVEMPMPTIGYDKEGNSLERRHDIRKRYRGGQEIGKLGPYRVVSFDYLGGGAWALWQDDEIVLVLRSEEVDGEYWITSVNKVSRPLKVRASQLYAWLVKTLRITLVSDDFMSPGGFRIWQELAAMPGIAVVLRENGSETAIDLDDFDRYKDQESRFVARAIA